MSLEYTLHYVRFGEPFDEGFETLNDALTRSSEILHRKIGCPKFVARKGVQVYEQEALFNDWLSSLQP